MCFWSQVQLQEETLEEDQTWPVNKRGLGSQCLSMSTSVRASSCWAWPQGGKPCYLEQRLFCTDTLCSCLTLKRPVVKLEVMLCDSLFKLSIYLQVVFFGKPNVLMVRCWHMGSCPRSSCFRITNLWKVFFLVGLEMIWDLCGLSSEIKTNYLLELLELGELVHSANA